MTRKFLYGMLLQAMFTGCVSELKHDLANSLAARKPDDAPIGAVVLSDFSLVPGFGGSAVAYGNNIWVVVKKGANAASYSLDHGLTWATTSSFGMGGWSAVTFGAANGGTFAAVRIDGDTNQAVTSVDGINWTLKSTPGCNPVCTWRGITYGNGIFVAVADSGVNRVMTSVDGGETWMLQASDAAAFGAVTYAIGRFVAVGAAGASMWSFDGVNWNSNPSITIENMTSVTYGHGNFRTVGQLGLGMISSDGVTWTGSILPIDVGGIYSTLAFGAGYFVTGGWSGANRIMISKSGTTWFAPSAAPQAIWTGVGYGNSTFILVSEYQNAYARAVIR